MGIKRPLKLGSSENDNTNNKRSKKFHIDYQSASPEFSDGILNVPDFIKSREFEIKSLETKNFHKSRRVFQKLPRKLRRRTASYNVKRIPKRLRNKAIREMLSSSSFVDNNIILNKKNKKNKYNAKDIYKLKMLKNLLKLSSKLNLMKILPNYEQATDQKFNINIRQRIKLIKKQICEAQLLKSKNSDQTNDQKISNFKIINNKIGSYDNTGINTLANKPVGKIKYTKRQKKYSWLTTHIWHAKRSHMIKRWGFNIPLKPTQKSYRLTHRNFLTHGSICWDTSYFSSLIIESDINNFKQLKKLVKLITNNMNKPLNSSVVNGKKFWEGNLYIFHNNNVKTLEIFTQGIIYWHKMNDSYKILIRIHPSTYEEYFNYLKELSNNKTIFAVNKHKNENENENENSLFKFYDCRYSLGSIEIAGPSSFKNLVSILHLNDTNLNKNWNEFSSISSLRSLPENSIISVLVENPGLYSRPVKPKNIKFDENRLIDLMLSLNSFNDDNDNDNDNNNNNDDNNDNNDDNTKNSINEINKVNTSQANLNSRKVIEKLLSIEGRTNSYNNQPSIKELSQRRKNLKPGMIKIPNNEKDPMIPILILNSNSNKVSFSKLILIAPWYWILPIWIKLNKITEVEHSGYLGIEQINFENNKLNFPDDYPFCLKGFVENEIKEIENHKKWKKRDKNHQINYDELIINKSHDHFNYKIKGEVGSPFKCDWRFLQVLKICKRMLFNNKKLINDNNNSNNNKVTSDWDYNYFRKINNSNDIWEFIKDIKVLDEEKLLRKEKLVNPIRYLNKSNISDIGADVNKFNDIIDKQMDIINKQNSNHNNINMCVDNDSNKEETKKNKTQRKLNKENDKYEKLINLKLLVKPIKFEIKLRGMIKDNARIYKISNDDDYQKYLDHIKGNNLKSNGFIQHNSINLPQETAPSFMNLIGYVTKSTYNLKEGKCTGIGYIDGEFYLNEHKKTKKNQQYQLLLLIRNVGSVKTRIASWKEIPI
ncbi:ribonuclease P/MRP protein subunit POP1 [Ascoidea rubescens DSM 1968]|uniref:POPLD-domain-containing protein n=1 Tax=Ascoidea rubescens DSM 1968 TaxID=1344418 RepID=A0A1D2VGT5_9ASCO|nr:POPLD-domain-containing protein [Ascoidea rubescens DSM 1968]ODV60868.1 POPLD-domain-containing protein [Ascoidea rubescens DSM 1968]